MLNKLSVKLRRLFCKHEFGEFVKNEPFHCISGETIYIVCKKCGKIKGSYFKEYEGIGYK